MERIKGKIPKRRFEGFTDDWEQRKFSDCYRMSSGYAFKMSDYCDGGIGLINGESIQHGIINDDNLNHLPESFIQQYPDFVLKEGDIVVGLNRPITNGNIKIARIPSKYNDSLLYQRAGKIVYKENCDKNFSYVLLSQEILKHTLVEAVGSDQPFISTSKLDKWQMMIPSNIEEQKKIGNYFRNLDHLITLHQRKLEKLKNIKKSYLSEMFPQEDEKKPKRRFKGFTDDWEQRKLSEVADFSKGNGYSKGDLCAVGTPIILYGRLYTKYETIIKKVDTFVIPKEGSVYSKGGEVIVPASGETAEDIARAVNVEKAGILLGGDLNIVTPNKDINSVFLALSISNGGPQKELSKKAQGKSVVHIHNEEIKGLEIAFPKREEQDRISTYFANLDHLITLHQRKLEKLKHIKQAYLNEMFV